MYVSKYQILLKFYFLEQILVTGNGVDVPNLFVISIVYYMRHSVLKGSWNYKYLMGMFDMNTETQLFQNSSFSFDYLILEIDVVLI